MDQREEIHRRVSDFYAKAISEPGAGGCCAPEQKGVAATFAGYGSEDLRGLPADAVENAFGCGNPVAFAGVREGDVVVDLGSGAGIDLLLAAPRVGPAGRVIGVDMTDEMIARARKNIAEAGFANVEVRKGLIEDLPVETASVDWVFSNCVINLSPDKPRVFAEIARVLRPGGRMAVSDIVVESLPDWVRRSEALHGACIAGAISESAYVAGLGKAGLVGVEVLDRLVYDASQLAAMVRSEVPDADADLGGRSLDEVAGSIAGKVWSARFTAARAE